MSRYVALTGSLAILSALLLPFDRAEAGASASAPSKYGHTSQVATARQVTTTRQARRTDFAITEYSSSSAKRSVPKR